MTEYIVIINTFDGVYGLRLEIGGAFDSKITADYKADIYRKRGYKAKVISVKRNKAYLTTLDKWTKDDPPVIIGTYIE